MKCPFCNGDGWNKHQDPFGDPPEQRMCVECDGSGEIGFVDYLRWRIAQALHRLADRFYKKVTE